ncbi:MAG: hypothetical protein ACRDT4_00170 [Micromonosporaceae bacterium]
MTEPYQPHNSEEDATERIVADAFASFRTSRLETATTPDLDQVYAAAATRRRQRTYLAGAGIAATLVLVAGTAAALTGLGKPDPGPVAGNTPSNRPSSSQSARPSEAPSASAPESPKDSPKPPPSIRDVDLRNLTLTLPQLMEGCPGGVLTFSDGETTGPEGCPWRIAYGDTRYADLDGAAGDEAVTTIAAGRPYAEYMAGVIALRRTADGSVEPMSYVFIADHSSQRITGISVSDEGAITVGIEDTSWDPQQPQRQDRTYRWTGAAVAFEQIGGPTAFPSPGPDPSDPGPTGSPSGG